MTVVSAVLATALFAALIAIGFLLWLVRYQREVLVSIGERHEAELVALRHERDVMMRTALDARGVQVIEAGGGTMAVAPPPSPFARIASKVKDLEEGYAKQALERDERLRERFVAAGTEDSAT